MKQEREVSVDGTIYRVVISDEKETLLAARAAGRVPVGLLHENGDQDLGAARFLVETPEAADERYLERVVRREIGLPWIIGESVRLMLREFTMADMNQVLREPDDQEADRVFYTPDKLEAYIRGQYGFYEYGLWAVVRKSDGKLVGKAGLTDCRTGSCEAAVCPMELGYHIFMPYRRKGYAEEACRMILNYAEQEYDAQVYADVESDNTASVGLLEKLGFRRMAEKIPEAQGAVLSCRKQADVSRESVSTGQKYTGSNAPRYRYVWK